MLHQGGITGCNTYHPSIGADEFIWALGSLSQLNRIPFDRALLLSQFPPPYDWSSLVQASTALGFRCEVAESPVETLDTWAFPCIAFVRRESAENDNGTTLVLLVRADTERVLLFKSGDNSATTLTRADFAVRYAG